MTIYVGLSGTNLAGKGVVRRIIEMNYDTISYSLSDTIREEARCRGIEVNRENLIALGNELRKKYGAGILAKRVLQSMRGVNKEVVIIDSIRNPEEIRTLRDALGKDIILLWIDAPVEVRFRRLKERMREGEDVYTFEKFVALDSEERSPAKLPHEGNITACKAYADYIIINDGTIEELIQKVNRIMTKVMNDKVPSLREAIKL